ncbi:MAG TPA: FAD-binding oxidoreductase, partial [Ornithinibacter sp.]|nr:FAD-binding oxidoreductase [Ornithinibacter sp.]
MTRSWWGWGEVERAVTAEEAAVLVARAAALLPDHDFTPHDPPDPASLDLPAPRVAVPPRLRAIASTEATDRLAHARGKAFRDVVRNLEGDVGPLPDVVLRPRDDDEVVAVLDW